MKVDRYRHCPTHAESCRRQTVGPADPSLERTHRMGRKIDDLLGGVNASVGSTGGNHTDRCVGDATQRFLERLLNRTLSVLPLPTMETTAVVFQTKRKMMIVRLQFVRANGAQR